jgi:hypothetical protein
VATSLAVWVGANDPQSALPQVTDQSTPACDESFTTFAVIGLVAPMFIDDGGGGLKETMIGGATVMEMLAEIDFVLSAVEVAVTFTVLPVGTAAGAV